jgi:hypothetical protein
MSRNALYSVGDWVRVKAQPGFDGKVVRISPRGVTVEWTLPGPCLSPRVRRVYHPLVLEVTDKVQVPFYG